MTGTLALMPQAPPTGLPCEPLAPKPNTKANIQARPVGPRQPRTQCDLNDIRLRRVSTAVPCTPSKHSPPTPDVLPRQRRSPTRATSAPSSASASSSEDCLSLVANAPPSLIMTTTTTTMTLPPPAQLRLSDSSPPFLLQKRHGPPAYFLQRAPSALLRSTPSTPHLKQKRSFNIAPIASPQISEIAATSSPRPPQTWGKVLDPSTPLASPRTLSSSRALGSTPQRSLPVLPPPPEKALPPIPFPSRAPSPPVGSSDNSRSLLLPAHPYARPVSQDEEETLRQLEQLAAELKQMRLGTLAAANQRRPGAPSQRRQREAPSKSPRMRVGSKDTLSVPRIVVTNPSTEDLGRELVCETPRVKTPDSDDGSGDVSEEELWVEAYGGWGTSEKGKWKASAPDEEASVHETVSSSPLPLNSRPASPAANPAERFYIYEPIGAPEFLVGSSTSPIARATAGFHSPPTKPKTSLESQTVSVRRRRRRPAALVLANPEQAEWFAEVLLSSAPPLPRPMPTPPFTHRPTTAPESLVARGGPSASSSRLSPRRAMSSDSADVSPTTASALGQDALPTHVRRSEPLVAMPRMSSVSALREEGKPDRQSESWAPSVPAASSVPNSPRQGGRPRLKSIKGLFKHFSK
ncbi:hypothetical protein BV20DRAFT_1053488 [Pilatotrama ljubarskyi]|nr:hypothetical protein BV20DRAFT_1053488 [Pilatotrama ljubarskyi]